MKLTKGNVCLGVLVTISLVALGAWGDAQNATAQKNAAQENRVPARVTDVVDDTNRVVLRGNVHPMARREFDQGPIDDSQPATRIVLLLQRSPEQEQALEQLMEDQQNKNSSNYHAWLTPEQFGKQFGPADTDIQAVTSWLTSHGFQVKQVAKGRTFIEFSGNIAQVRNAFQTEIHRFVAHGKEHFANVSNPQIPAALAPVVAGIRSLHNFHPKPQARNLGTFRRTPDGQVRPLFTYTDSNGQFFAVGPADFRTIYNITIPIATAGSGQSIAIVGQSNINTQDVIDFRNMFGLPAYSSICTGTPGQCPLTIVLNGPDPGTGSVNGDTGDEGESDLDVEWAGAVAPAATINFVTTQTTDTDFTSGIDGSAMYIVDNNVAPILSESYGSCEANLGTAGNQFYNSLWQQAAAEGISVVIAAGDNGSAGCDPGANATNTDVAALGLAISGIASTPYNIAAGGTDFDQAGKQTTFWNTTNAATTQASALGYIPETSWNDSCASSGSTTACTSTIINNDSSTGADLAAGGGGPSNCETQTATGACSAGYPKPTWQQGGVITPNDAVRDIPDISLFSSDGGANDANKSFYIICQSDQDPSGGTGCNLTTNTANANHDFQAVGGTSAATPTFAAIIALINQAKSITNGQGNANYALYNTYSAAKGAGNVCASAASPASTCVFYDITKGNNSVACQGGTSHCSNSSTSANQYGILVTTGTTPAYSTSSGYDLATGLGSVNVGNLLTAWAIPGRTASSVTLNSLPATITIGQAVTVSGNVSPPTATGVVLLDDQLTGAVIPANSGQSNATTGGSFGFTSSMFPAGAYTVIAHYGGDGTFASANSTPPQTVTVAKANSQVVVSFVTFTGANGTTPVLSTAAQSLAYGSNYILRIDVENASVSPAEACENQSSTPFFPALTFACPTGTVQLLNGGNPLNDFPNAQNANATNVARLNDRGFAEDQLIQLPVGSYSITATYTPDANSSYNAPASASNTLPVTITKATTTTTVSPTTTLSGANVLITATVASGSNGEALCGSGVNSTVQFMKGSAALSGTVAYTGTSGAQSSNGQASCTAVLSTTSAQLLPMDAPRTPPTLPLWMVVSAWVLAAVLLLFAQIARVKWLRLKWAPSPKLAYTVVGLALIASLSAAIAGCSGTHGGSSSGGGGGGTHTDNITAVYSGDANYSGSTSSATPVSIQ